MIFTDLFESKDMCHVCGQTPCNCTHIAESAGSVGDTIRSLYQQFYDQGDDALEYLNTHAENFARYWDRFEGDLDSMIEELPPKILARLAQELQTVAAQEGLEEAYIAPALSAANAAAEYQRSAGGYRGRVDVKVGSREEYMSALKALRNAANQAGQHVEIGRNGSTMSVFSDSMGSDELGQFVDNTLQQGVAEEKVRLDPKCWKGKKIGNPKTKMKGGVRVNNCVPAESVEENYDNGEYSDEAGMAHGNLITIAKAARGLLDTIDQHEDLPEWVQEKIAKVEGMLVSAWNYLQSQEAQGIDPRVSEMYANLAENWQRVSHRLELNQEFDLIESIVESIADRNGVDAETVWADLESLTEDELYVFAVTSEPIMEDWQKANKRDKTDGMSRKAVKAYRREHPGSKLQTAVTTKPSKLKKGSKASKRRKSYCSRSRGQMKMHNISCAKTPDKAICKARRRWNCEGVDRSGQTVVSEGGENWIKLPNGNYRNMHTGVQQSKPPESKPVKPAVSHMYKVGWNDGVEDEYNDQHSNNPQYDAGFYAGLEHAMGPKGLGRSNPRRYNLDQGVAEGDMYGDEEVSWEKGGRRAPTGAFRNPAIEQHRKVFKKNGKPVGEVGIDPEASPGNGQWYMKCYAYNIDNSGYDSYEEAVEELKYCLKQGMAEVSDATLTSYLTKVDADSQKHEKDPTKRSAEKRNKSVSGFSRAFNKLDARKEKTEEGQMQENDLAQQMLALAKKVSPNARLAGTPDEERARTQQMMAQRAQDRKDQPAQEVSAEQRAQLQAKLKELEAKFDPNYEYSDDHSFWSKQNAIARQISGIRKQLSITEISKQKLGDYLHAAHQDVVDRATSSSFQSGQAGDKYNRADVSPKEKQREVGMQRAVKRLTREGSSVAEAWASRYPNLDSDIEECQASGDDKRLGRLMAIKNIIDSELGEQAGLGFGEHQEKEADYGDEYQSMVQRMGQKAREQQKIRPVDIADLARKMRAIDQSKDNK